MFIRTEDQTISTIQHVERCIKMVNRAILFLLALSLCSCAKSTDQILAEARKDSEAQYSVSFRDTTDKFNGERLVGAHSSYDYKVSRRGRPPNSITVSTIAKISPGKPPSYQLVLHRTYSIIASLPLLPAFRDCKSIQLNINGTVMSKSARDYRSGTHTNSEYAGTVRMSDSHTLYEFLNVPISESDLISMSRSNNISYRACVLDGNMAAEEIDGLKRVAATVLR